MVEATNVTVQRRRTVRLLNRAEPSHRGQNVNLVWALFSTDTPEIAELEYLGDSQWITIFRRPYMAK
jgi:hypothetical protein